jgi:hypothetical protein
LSATTSTGLHGKAKCFGKTWGWILGDDGLSYFVHFSAIVP